jgi:hypothetical protein
MQAHLPESFVVADLSAPPVLKNNPVLPGGGYRVKDFVLDDKLRGKSRSESGVIRTHTSKQAITSPCSSLAVELTTNSSLLHAIESSTSNVTLIVMGTLFGPRVCKEKRREREAGPLHQTPNHKPSKRLRIVARIKPLREQKLPAIS